MLNHLIYLSLCALVNPLLWGLYISNYSSEKHYRFANNSQFIGKGYDFSGVGMNLSYGQSSTNGQWATMISPNVFITTHHWYQKEGTTINFWADNDISKTITRTVSSNGQRIGKTDLWLGTLNQALPSNYTYYDISNSFKDPFDKNNTVFSVGSHNKIVNNALSDIIEFVVGHQKIDSSTSVKGSEGNAFMSTLSATNPSYTEYGDSGSPIFLFDNNKLSLLGITMSAIFPDSSDTGLYTDVNKNGIYDPYIDINLKQTTYFSDVKSYNTEIKGFIARHAIPEPATILGVLPIAIFGIFRFLRKRAEQKDNKILK